MSDCVRCGEPVEHGHGDRFQVRGWDYTESTAATYSGQLCQNCWSRFVEFILGQPVFEHRRREGLKA